MIQDRLDPTGLIQYFIDAGYPLHDVDEINSFTQVVMTAYNNTRIYENNGLTPNEVQEIYQAMRPKNSTNELVVQKRIKVGVNAPCSCGSEKKYKKCSRLVGQSQTAQLASK